MEILGVKSIATATIKFTIDEKQKDGKNVMLKEKDEAGKKGFWTLVSKSLADKLEIGNTITVVCTPVSDLSFATETLGLILHRSDSVSEQLYDRGNYLKDR